MKCYTYQHLLAEHSYILVERFWRTHIAACYPGFPRGARCQFTFFKYQSQQGKQRVTETGQKGRKLGEQAWHCLSGAITRTNKNNCDIDKTWWWWQGSCVCVSACAWDIHTDRTPVFDDRSITVTGVWNCVAGVNAAVGWDTCHRWWPNSSPLHNVWVGMSRTWQKCWWVIAWMTAMITPDMTVRYVHQ